MNTEHKSNTPTEIRDLWQTPKFVFDYYDRRFNFTGDIAASEKNALCDVYIDSESNALDDAQYWFARGWLNPPFSDITPWVEKAIDQMQYKALTVMLLPADTSVKWFKLAFDNCTECHFISGRLSFVNAETQKPVSGNNKGSVVFVFDPLSPVNQSVHLIDRDSMK
jgi:phage N-6-adenine-methyltransferase